MIELTHYLSDFLKDIYLMIRSEILEAEVLHADETPHNMLEGDATKSWYLWGFSTETANYFEYHDTRSGDVASGILLEAQCSHLVSDIYSGYKKAVTVCNRIRPDTGLPVIEHVYCNAHARRKFREMSGDMGAYFVEKYREIYHVDNALKALSAPERLLRRQQLTAIFEEMKGKAIELWSRVSAKSFEAQTLNYFIKNFDGLTSFLKNPALPIDNNRQERLLRNPVIGRKTWYGTHSKRGAETAAILFSIVETCKLNNVNPRSYLQQIVRDLHQKKKPYTPRQAAIDSLSVQ